jgi:GPH family glycoside/pentoside/hexuronide:cation symporter
MTSQASEKLPTKTKILYGAGDFGFSLTDTTIGVLYAIFLTDVVGIRAGNAAWVFLIGRIWDFVNDPVMGYISDRTRSRWGRRRPYLLFGFIPFAIAFTLLWIKPPITGDMALVAYYAFAYILYDAAATAVYMPYFALTPELTLDYDERTKLTSFRMFFSIVAGLIGFTVPLMVIGETRPENADKVLMIGAIFGLASALPLLLTFFGTRERPEFQQQSTQPIGESLRAAFKNRPFLFAMFIFLFTWAAVNLVQSMMLFFLKYRMDMETDSDLIMGTVFVTALITLPLWEWISRNTDKRKAYIGGMVFLSAVLTVLAFLSPDAGMTFVLSLAFLAGIGVAAVHVLPWSMIPDAVEWDEYETGNRHEGMFYSLVTLLRKVASAIALPSMLWILEASGFVSNAPSQSDSAIKAIISLTGPGPAFFMFLGILFALFYPLSRERHAQIRTELQARRVTGKGE